MNRLANTLTGEGVACFSEVTSHDQLDDYELLMQILKNRFRGSNPEDQMNIHRSEFRARVQHSGKDATAFGNALKQLAPRAYLMAYVENNIVKQIVDGLLYAQVHCHL